MAKNRVALVTGASAGIGREASKALVADGWRVIGTGRDSQRISDAEKDIRASAKNGGSIEMIRADLALLSDTERLAQEVSKRTDRLDALLANAGGTPAEKVVTAEGYEATFVGNHLGHFLLVNRLLPLLKKAAADSKKGDVRVISTSSSAHEYTPGLDWDDLQSLKNFTTSRSYMNAKLCNVLFTRTLAKRLASTGIVAHAAHPGMVDTLFASRGDDAMQKYFAANIAKSFTAAQGADTVIWLTTAAEPGASSGGYFFQRAPGTVSAFGQSDANAERLWTESEALVTRAGHKLGAW